MEQYPLPQAQRRTRSLPAESARFRREAPKARVRLPDGSAQWPRLWVVAADDAALFEIVVDPDAGCWRLPDGRAFDLDPGVTA